MMMSTRVFLSLFLSSIPLCQGSNRLEFSRGVETLRDHLASDLGFSSLPNVKKANLSMTEYVTKMEIYQKIKRQAENIKRIQEEFKHHKFTTPTENILEMSEFSLLEDDKAKLKFDLREFDKFKFGSILIKSAKLNLNIRKKDPSSLLNSKVKVIQITEGIQNEGTVVDSQEVLSDGREAVVVSFDVADTVQAWILEEDSQQGFIIEAPGLQLADESGSAVLVVHAEFSLTRHRRSVLFPGLSRADQDISGPAVCGGAAENKCCRDDMVVKFKDLEGFNFILEPTEFNAFMCRGKCPARFRPLNDHSLLQSLMHMKQQRQEGRQEIKERRVRRPCCVPARLTSLPILHLDEENPSKLKVTVWKSIIVTECACG